MSSTFPVQRPDLGLSYSCLTKYHATRRKLSKKWTTCDLYESLGFERVEEIGINVKIISMKTNSVTDFTVNRNNPHPQTFESP